MSRTILLDGIETRIIEFTPHSTSEDESNVKIVIIPGNPGNSDYYHEFAFHLFDLTKRKNAISVISHAGHAPPVRKRGNPSYFTLRDQVQHKLAYLALDSHKNAEIILIGHSLGCYVIQEMMKILPRDRVTKAFQLFPAIERLRLSPKGIFFQSILGRLSHHIIRLTCYAFHYCLPTWVSNAIIGIRFRSLPDHRKRLLSRSTSAILNPTSMSNIMDLSWEELDVIYPRDDEFIRDHKDKLVFYYGRSDEWVPINFYHDLVRDFPDNQIHLCDMGLFHAFVFNGPVRMAAWIFDHM